ncbi:MAG: hypothetical protein WDA20_02820 [Desulfuromonadales bacterium]
MAIVLSFAWNGHDGGKKPPVMDGLFIIGMLYTFVDIKLRRICRVKTRKFSTAKAQGRKEILCKAWRSLRLAVRRIHSPQVNRRDFS